MCEFFVRNSLPRLFWSRDGLAARWCWHIFAHKPCNTFVFWNVSRCSLHMRILGVSQQWS